MTVALGHRLTPPHVVVVALLVEAAAAVAVVVHAVAATAATTGAVAVALDRTPTTSTNSVAEKAIPSSDALNGSMPRSLGLLRSARRRLLPLLPMALIQTGTLTPVPRTTSRRNLTSSP